MFKFINIDSFRPGRFERVGMLKGKRWYVDTSKSKETNLGLFKPQRYEFKDRKVFCGNHYGEFVGYLLANNASIPACPVELAELSKYYSNIHKERNGGTPEHKKGCISYTKLKPEETLEAGKLVIDKFKSRHPDKFEKILKRGIAIKNVDDSIDVFLAAIEYRIRDFYLDYRFNNKFRQEAYNDCAKNETSKEYIDNKVREAINKAINMIVYDCLYGNNDRHDENWSMYVKMDSGKADLELYELYDNERVLGLYENQNNIEKSLKEGDEEEFSEKLLFSRMKVPQETKTNSSYKDVLNYMMLIYPEETRNSIKSQISANTPEKVNEFLESCEGLPKPYIDFGTKVYKSRYNFAKELLNKHRDIKNSKKELLNLGLADRAIFPRVKFEIPKYHIDYTDEIR